jgi:uncharacterized membrane protein YcaP (DUF421 family)
MLDKLVSVEWSDLVIPTHSVLEMILRGTVMYIGLLLIFRFIVQRQRSTIGIPDLLVLVLIADASQNAFSHEYRSITEGLVLVLTIVLLDFLIDWLAYHYKFFGWLVRPAPLPLIRDGKMNHRNMRQEMISVDELRGQARAQGIGSLSEVKVAHLEANGDVSFVKREDGATQGHKRTKKV